MMTGYKMFHVDVMRKYIANIGETKHRYEYRWKQLVLIDEVENHEQVRCAYCGGNVVIHKGKLVPHHVEHAVGEGKNCPFHSPEFDEQNYLKEQNEEVA